MRIESILGITASIIAIGTLVYQGFQKFQHKDLSAMFTKLADKNTSIKKQRYILRKIDVNLRSSGGSISNAYIRNFSAEGRSKSIIFHDICMNNQIEPTKDLCVRALGYDEPTFRKEWQKHYTSDTKVTELTGEVHAAKNTVSSSCIQDWDTDFVYISDKLKVYFPDFYHRLCSKFTEMGILFEEIKDTKDIWCRDYMPIQIAPDTFVGYTYSPNYLRSEKNAYPELPEWTHLRCCDVLTNQEEVWKKNEWTYKLISTDIVLDGGNIVLADDFVLLTDKIYAENNCQSSQDNKKLLDKIQEAFQHTPIIIPWQPKGDDVYGHTDGVVKAMPSSSSNSNLMISPLFKYERDSLYKALDKYFTLNEIEFPERGKNFEKYAWAYINFLQVGYKILVPSFGLPCEPSIMEQIRNLYPNCIVDSIEMREIADHGGALHCITWNIKK